MVHAEGRYFGCSNCGIVDCSSAEGLHHCESQSCQVGVQYVRIIINECKSKTSAQRRSGLNVTADGSQDTC